MGENEFQQQLPRDPSVALTDTTPDAAPPVATSDYNGTASEQTAEQQTALVPVQQQAVSHPSVPVIKVENIKKTYYMGDTKVHALRDISLEVQRGEFVAIMGPSGSGKTTFMNLLGCLDRPTRGTYTLAGRLVSDLSADELAAIRNQLIGFVFQGFNLLARATALKNVMLPLMYAGYAREERERHARRALKLVGLGTRMNHRPNQLSGGQQQRVAIARALVNNPSLLLADEPTGNLDSRTSLEIMAVLQALNQRGLTIVLVTHDADIAAFAGRQVAFRDGRVVRNEPVDTPRSARGEWATLTKASQNARGQGNVQIEEEQA